MRTLIFVTVLACVGGWMWFAEPLRAAGDPQGLAGSAFGLTEAPSHSGSGAVESVALEPVTASVTGPAPSLVEDLARLEHLTHIVDRPALRGVAARLQTRFRSLSSGAVSEELSSLNTLNTKARLSLALCEAKRLLGEVQQAVEFGEQATALLPQHSEAHLQHAKAIAEQMRVGGLLTAMSSLGTYKDLIARAIELDRQNFSARAAQIGYMLFAPGLLGGDTEQARRLCDDLDQDDPRRAGLMRALSYAQEEQVDEALKACEEVLQSYPGDQSLQLSVARMLHEEQRLDEAATRYDSVLGGPHTAKYYLALYHRAVLRVEAKQDLEMALAAFQEYERAEPYGEFLPGLATSHWRQGQVYEQLGRDDLARASYEKALAVDEDFDQAEDALDALG